MSKRTILVLGLGAVLALLVGATIAFAGPVGLASGFEDDDGNLIDNTAANPPDTPGIDWDTFRPLTWTGTAPYREADKVVSGWTVKGIEDDQVDTTDTAFAGGVKQDNNCAPLDPGKAPNKDDLKRIYLSTKNVGGDVYLNLAWVRIPQNTTSASAHVGFEFNQNDGLDANGNPSAAERCGGGSPLVQRKAGDLLIVYDFAGSSTDTPKISLRKWITSGTCEVGSSTPPCWGVATNLTQTGVAEGKVNTSDVGSVLDRLGPNGNETLGNNEFGEAGINLTDAGVFGPNTCQSFGKVFGVSRSSGNSEKAAMKDLVGPGDFTLANCGTVIIRKQTAPNPDTTTNFGYTTNVTTTPSTNNSPFSLKDDGVKTIVNVNPASGLHVTEDNPGPNYALTSINCDVAANPSTVPAGNRSTNTTTRLSRSRSRPARPSTVRSPIRCSKAHSRSRSGARSLGTRSSHL